MFCESISAFLRHAIRCSRFFAYEFFFDLDVFCFFQRCAVAGEIAVGGAEKVFHLGKINPIVDHKNGHNAQSYTTFEFFVELIDVEH